MTAADELMRQMDAIIDREVGDPDGNNYSSANLRKWLRSAIEQVCKDAERWQWGVKHARWIRHEHEAYIAIPVARDADLSCVALRIDAIDAAIAHPPAQRGEPVAQPVVAKEQPAQ